MATTTVAPASTGEETVKKAPLILTPQATRTKVREIMATHRIRCRPGCAIGVAGEAARGSSIPWP